MNKDQEKRILLSHGSGGKIMHELIRDLFQKKFQNEMLDRLSDSAILSGISTKEGELCFTTDSYVVNPIFFPGGDIGKLAVCGTINDLAVEGAVPLYLSCGMIIEEGLEYETLEKIANSMARTAQETGVKIVTGDLKVVEKNKADKIFINTAGIGLRRKGLNLGKEYITIGDKILINGTLGDHGIAVLTARGIFQLETDIQSDCAALTPLIQDILNLSDQVKFMRDPTRGGLATTLNEIVSGASFAIEILEQDLPIKEETKAACELLGFDPLFLANEGKAVIIAGARDSDKILERMKKHPLGKDSRIIGKVVPDPPGKVVMRTSIGSHRIIDMLVGEQLPRIC